MMSINVSGNTLLHGGRRLGIMTTKYQDPTVQIDDDVPIPTTIRPSRIENGRKVVRI
jgi:hypothetical protein